MQRAFADMFNVKTLAGLLFRSPLTDTPGDPRRAGPPFELPDSLDIDGRTPRQMWQLQLELTQTSAKCCAALLKGAAAPPGGSKRFLLTLTDLDINDINRITAIVGRCRSNGPMTERSVDVTIEALRILPPFAIARLGSGAPIDSYLIKVDDTAPLDWRTIVPTTTFVIDPSTGAITGEFVPDEIEFTEEVNGVVKIRKVAPFLELWAVTDDDRLVPVTIDLLKQNGATPSDLTWAVAVGNRKVERRTGDASDAVTAFVTGISDHAEHPLLGTSPNFVAGGGIDFGTVRYIQPTTAYPQIRFRFTPADGGIYASNSIEQDKALRDWERPLHDR